MLRSDYFRLQKLEAKLLKKFRQKEDIMNQDIIIRDIFVYPIYYDNNSETTFGELLKANPYHMWISSKKRLYDHIEILAKIATLYHQTYYCKKDTNGAYQIKPYYVNHITRIVLSEYSLHSQNYPLSIDDLSVLIENIIHIASKQNHNIHLVLSSIAVIDNDYRVYNMLLHVQCGPEPEVHTLCKARWSDVDRQYESTYHYSQREKINPKRNKRNKHIASGYISTFPRKGGSIFFAANGPELTINYKSSQSSSAAIKKKTALSSSGITTISSDSLIPITTLGGAKCTQFIDMCVDHQFAHSKQLLIKSLDADVTMNTQLIPDQVDHLVTSNTIPIINKSKISPSVTHIDPVKDIAHHMEDDKIQECHLQTLINPEYKEMSICKVENGFRVSNPPFGHDYQIVATQERLLDEFSNSLRIEIKKKNSRVRNYILDYQLEQTVLGKEYIQFNKKLNKTATKINHLHLSLKEQCKSGFFESFSNTMKPEAIAIIKNSITAFEHLSKDVFNYALCAKELLEVLKLKFAALEPRNALVSSLIEKVTQTLNEIPDFSQLIKTKAPTPTKTCSKSKLG